MNTDRKDPFHKAESRELGPKLNYLKVFEVRLGYILNFKQPKLEGKRVVR